MRREKILDLVSACHGAPLRRLVLDGLNYVGEELFHSIADAFPSLQSLALLYRQNALQRHSRARVWPEPTWIYAKYLSSFRHLRQFAWNFSIEPIYVGTNYNLPYMEEDYPDHWIGDYQLEYFSDWSCLAKLFVAHCPTLESLMFTSNRVAMLGFSISQDKTGHILVVASDSDYLDDQIEEINPYQWVNLERSPWRIDERT
ncbi:uncharacterized protein LAESUDRAFT_104421 [Laetiporus sulphureus 93-53]|uniref:Uncharacterized protein n=1 Tax=Laetiporus sulphureus 93-53 TaxID=1314785 RepID=A0A165ETQ6_9APHY|nr:uncharacterized protein LAESUDRAFT_104421 [Laetiporus sulphureus 93-53]KZT07740.1 hypothetical protein LAESUDRAFT_104421 [Laetiporus sulphureus 93-53]